MLISYRVLVLALLLLYGYGAANLRAQELPFTHYTTDDPVNPLPKTAVTAVYQDRSGYLWIANYGAGLLRYDGRAFERYATEDGLVDDNVWGMLEDANGRLWVHSDNGMAVSEKPLAAFAPGSRLRFTSKVGRTSLFRGPMLLRSQLTIDAEDRVWIGTRDRQVIRYTWNGPDELTADTLQTPPEAGGVRAFNSIVGRRDGTVWIGTFGGHLQVYRGGESPAEVVDGPSCAAIDALYESPSGVLWGGCREGLVWRLHPQAGSRRFDTYRTSTASMVTAIWEDTQGRVWVTSLGGGITVFFPDRPDRPVVYTRQNGLPDLNVWDVMQDREGNYWIAQNSGLSKLRYNYEAFGHYTGRSHAGERPVLPAPDVTSVIPPFHVHQSGRRAAPAVLVAGTPGGVAFVREGEQTEYVTSEQGLPNNLVLSLCQDHEQNVWITTRDGISRITFGPGGELPGGASSTRNLTLFGEQVRLSSYRTGHMNSCRAFSLAAGPPEAARIPVTCFSGEAGLLCLARGQWLLFEASAGLAAGDFWSVTADEQGYFYVGSKDEGLFQSSRPLTWEALNELSKRKPERSTIPLEVVAETVFRPLAVPSDSSRASEAAPFLSHEDALWIQADGLVVLEGQPPHVRARLSKESGLPDHVMSMAYSPKTGTLWAGTGQGLIEIDPAKREVTRWLTKADGLVGNGVWGIGAVAVGADGTVYFGTSSGLSLYRPHLDRINAVAPIPRLSYVSFHEDSGGHNELRLDFAALSFANEKDVRYKTRLLGYDPDWSGEGTETSVRYTNLGAFLFPRTYTLEVNAANNDGIWAETPLRYSFPVRPAWWLRWWAFSLYGILLAAAVFAADRLQRRRLLRRERERAEREAEKLRAEAAEAWANYLQSENQRQTQELEQARQLQLSMLPKKLPEHPRVDLAAYMQTATEVGGDYYDFDLSEDGTLTLAIGDATGHGVQAGTMVTAAKSLFLHCAREPDLVGVLRKATQTLRRMHLPRLYMALALGKLRDGTLELAGAGMPPALIYRAASGRIEQVPLKGMPLGTGFDFPYENRRIKLAGGDTLLLISDGFPELRDSSDEMLGYDQVPEIFAEVADRSPEEIIAHLKRKAKTWCDGRAPGDDMTFIVVKVKGHAGADLEGDGAAC